MLNVAYTTSGKAFTLKLNASLFYQTKHHGHVRPCYKLIYRLSISKCIGAYEEKLTEAGVNFDKRIRKKPLETTIRLHQSQKV